MTENPSIRTKSTKEVLLEFADLRARLDEAEETLQAIRSGEVDALVVWGPKGEQVFTLKGADQPYRVFVEQMQEGAATLGPEGIILYGNQRFAEMLERPLERTMGEPLGDLVVEADRAVLQEALERVAENGFSRSEVSLRGTERPRPVLLSITRLDDEQEAHYALTVTDLTDRKRHEEILASERLARSILENAAEAIVVCDRESRIIASNGAANRLIGGIGTHQRFEQAFPLEMIEASTESPQDRALQGNTVRGVEAKFATPSRTYDLLVGAGPLSENGEVVGCVVTMTDITDRNAAVRAVRELNESLERRVEERTEQLKAANHELEGFTYSVSHDLRTPLRSMMSASMILIEDYSQHLPEGADGELRKLARAAKRMADLIDDLLRFSRLGRQEIRREQVNLSEVAEIITEELQEANPGVEFQIDPEMVVQGDRMLLKMVLENLLGNAVKFSSLRESPAIVFRRGEPFQGSPTFVVSDNGIGFDQQYVGKIFQPFERLHSDREYPGTGIGLANVHRIIARHGGKVWAEGQIGHGATFTFTIGE